MVAHIEHDFRLFSQNELDTGLQHAAQKDRVTLDRGRLASIANNAGKTRLALLKGGTKLTPREVATRAIRSYLREYRGINIPEKYFTGYVHAVAKMLSERNPTTKQKRERDALAAEILAISHNIDQTPDIDPQTNAQIALMLQEPRSKADTP